MNSEAQAKEHINAHTLVPRTGTAGDDSQLYGGEVGRKWGATSAAIDVDD